MFHDQLKKKRSETTYEQIILKLHTPLIPETGPGTQISTFSEDGQTGGNEDYNNTKATILNSNAFAFVTLLLIG